MSTLRVAQNNSTRETRLHCPFLFCLTHTVLHIASFKQPWQPQCNDYHHMYCIHTNPGDNFQLMYQSIPSLTIPQGFARSHCPGVGFSPNFLCSGVRRFELDIFSTVLKEKCRNFSIYFKETGGSLKSRCSPAVSYQFLQKQ